uniref:Uncharacterized protein n=1 Tax=Castor canadensis TaxID=51338 RepID=A0A8C0WM93_CASCN
SFHGLETDLPFCQPPGLPLTASTLQLSLGWSPTPFFMVSLLCCVPKLTTCGIVLSAWGVPMLIMLGIFFNVHSAVLIETSPKHMDKIIIGLNKPKQLNPTRKGEELTTNVVLHSEQQPFRN